VVVVTLKRVFVFSLALMMVITGFLMVPPDSTLPSLQKDLETDIQSSLSQADLDDYDQFSRGNFTGTSFSHVNLSVILDDIQSTVVGNLTIEYHNDESIAFSSIPFHLR
jgi:hypothetical protein